MKINSKWIKDLNIRPDTIKLLEKIQAENSDIHHSKIFSDPPPRVTKVNTKINLKAFAQEKKSSTKLKYNIWAGSKYLQIM